ncbi:MAG: CoB--CoM heterodisulfide reductase iron-sulfur subunit A family protein, partial [Bacteroidetes bacterium]|nr:CoB--CoM heterodisulfide reductase iron-sulfur subunit A family protein [Bacteroidota bacterium]
EKEANLGGRALRIPTTLEGLDVDEYLKELISKVYKHPLIFVSHSATITDVSGYVGNFVTTVVSEGRNKTIKHGAAILATGAVEYRPTEYLYGTSDKVMTSVEMGEQLARGDKKLADAKSLVMIQCVGCRQEDRNYCSRVCCTHSIKNALKVREINPEIDIYILFRDIRTYGYSEDYYRMAADKDVKFIQYEPHRKPKVEAVKEGDSEVLRLSVMDPIMGKELVIDADILSLAAAVISSEGSYEASRLFKVPLNEDGFFQEAHVKLRPVDFSAEGVYLCGTAHYPKHISEAISQAYGAAGRAVTLLSQDSVTASGSVCEVDENACVSCGACIKVCTYGAIAFGETNKAIVNSVLCKGDGLCNVVCPTSAISLSHYTDEELLTQIDAANEKI